MAPFHVRSKVCICIAPIHVRSKLAYFALHMDGSNADFDPHMEGSHTHFTLHMEWRQGFRGQPIVRITNFAIFLKEYLKLISFREL